MDGYGSVVEVVLPPVELVGATVVVGSDRGGGSGRRRRRRGGPGRRVVVGGMVVVVVTVVVGAIVVVGAVVVVGGTGTQPVTQKTLCLTSAPWEPSALMVSLTWKPWAGAG